MINLELITELVAHLAVNGKNAGVYGASAILVFMRDWPRLLISSN